jgi:hypothetical protein
LQFSDQANIGVDDKIFQLLPRGHYHFDETWGPETFFRLSHHMILTTNWPNLVLFATSCLVWT